MAAVKCIGMDCEMYGHIIGIYRRSEERQGRMVGRGRREIGRGE